MDASICTVSPTSSAGFNFCASSSGICTLSSVTTPTTSFSTKMRKQFGWSGVNLACTRAFWGRCICLRYAFANAPSRVANNSA
jgi:hypothetical protein